MLSRLEKERYLRHIMLEDVGEEGQLKLLKSSVLVVGAGGLGSAVLMYLCAAGIGKIGIVDFDVVDMSNLQRQPHSACLACVFDKPPKKGLNPISGLFGVLPGVLGCIQASECLKYFLGFETLLINTLLIADIKTMDFKKIQAPKNPECRVCGTHKITHLQDYEI
ncbi:HesA/MoeB/ThiF family protein [Helicobacter pylori]|uniref:HesA/MoeB/ThiF family protein n=1 Tax=Helicobacter pylori TaxID=210 RepID=UPI0018F1F327|nr:ThiF family adenylyltransferase [Helicobacter pylori]